MEREDPLKLKEEVEEGRRRTGAEKKDRRHSSSTSGREETNLEEADFNKKPSHQPTITRDTFRGGATNAISRSYNQTEEAIDS